LASATDQTAKANAEPTKEFFISMLVKDIELIRAILDLIDNAVDGARRLRVQERFDGLNVRVDVTEHRFRIADNCGGIDLNLARNYAFRFGRPSEMPKMARSVGQFGVGMKRALFKLGKHFKIESTTATSHFAIEEDVETWKKHDRWEFAFQQLQDNMKNDVTVIGTVVLVTNLHDAVSDEFRLETFVSKLKREIEAAHQESMYRGLAITLNKVPLAFRANELLHSDGDLRPAYEQIIVKQSEDSQPVTVKVYAGIGSSDPVEAGWYIYCNGRLVVESDQTLTTGWGERGGKAIPKFHNQFARFRGYVLFDCDDAGLLPWNTTKTGVDSDSGLYRRVRQKMITIMRPIIDFLNRLDAEADRASTDKPLTKIVDDARPVVLAEIPEGPFEHKARPTTQPAPLEQQKITYWKSTEQIRKVKTALRVKSLKEVGERTFEYFYENECGA